MKVIIDGLTKSQAPSAIECDKGLSDPNLLSIDNKNYTGVDSANPTVVPVQSHQEKLMAVNQIPFLWNKPCTKHVSETGVPLRHARTNRGWHKCSGDLELSWERDPTKASAVNRKEFLRGSSHHEGVPNGPGLPTGKNLNMVRRHGNKHGNQRWKAWARVGHQWHQFSFGKRDIRTAEIFDLILSKRDFTTVAELKTVKKRVLELFKPVKEFPAVDGFVHVRKNGAKKWRVYKVVGGKRLQCQCRNEGNAKRVLLEVAVAKSTVTTVHELRALVQNCLPEIAARKPFQTVKANECNHYWAGKYTKKLVTVGFHYCGEIIPPAIREGMLAIHKKNAA